MEAEVNVFYPELTQHAPAALLLQHQLRRLQVMAVLPAAMFTSMFAASPSGSYPSRLMSGTHFLHPHSILWRAARFGELCRCALTCTWSRKSGRARKALEQASFT